MRLLHPSQRRGGPPSGRPSLSYLTTVSLEVEAGCGWVRVEAERSAFDCSCGQHGTNYLVPGFGISYCLACQRIVGVGYFGKRNVKVRRG
jgi:hypothetical protein